MEEEEKETLMITNDTQVEEVKKLNEIRDSLLDLDKCSLHELIDILQKNLINHLLMFMKHDLALT
jgi:hypothetical protein